MEQQKYLMKLQGLEGEANHLGEQLKVIDQQISEMNLLKENLNHLEKSGESEMFAELGKGIFIKATLKKSGLLVDVGNKVFVHKSVKDICDVVAEQINKFDKVKIDVSKRINDINLELNEIISKTQEAQKSDKSGGKGGAGEKCVGGKGVGGKGSKKKD